MVSAVEISRWIEVGEWDEVEASETTQGKRAGREATSRVKYHSHRRHSRRATPNSANRGPRRRLRKSVGV